MGRNPYAIAFAPDGKTAWVSNEGSDTLSVLDAGSGAVIAEVAGIREPHGLAFAPDGRALWVISRAGDGVAIVDTASRRVLETLPVGKRPHVIAVKRPQ